jgi:HSP20 family protein
MNGNELTVQGKINTEEPAAGETYHRKGRPAGTFMRTLQLPFRADSGGTKANYKNGVLRLTIPRSEAEKPKKIAVEAS